LHTSLISLDVADIRFRDHSPFSSDGIAVPMPDSSTTRPSA
jgi:hypothetical protein